MRKKIILVISLALILLFTLQYFISRLILLNGFMELEKKFTFKNVHRARGALEDRISSMAALLGDWAAWDATKDFILEPDKSSYIEDNLMDETFINLNLNFMLFINSSGEIVYSKCFDLKNKKTVECPPGFKKHISTDGLLLLHKDTRSVVKGIITISKKPALIASHPIVDSYYGGPVCGTMIIGRYLDEGEVENIARSTSLSLAIFEYNEKFIPEGFRDFTNAVKGIFICIEIVSPDLISGYTILKDIYGESACILKVDMKREIYAQGNLTTLYFSIALFIAGLIIMGLILLLLEVFVLRPLSHLGKSVKSIGSTGNIATRILFTGSDELAVFAGTINNMLAKLEKSRNKLAEREEQYRTLVSNLPDLIIIMKEDKILYINQIAKTVLGCKSGEVIGKSILDYVDDDCEDMVVKNMEKRKNKEEVDDYIINIVTEGGEKRVVIVRGGLTTYENEEAILLVLIDITEIKKAEEVKEKLQDQLRHSDRLATIGKLSAGIAHELNEPLGNILGFAQLARKVPRIPEVIKGDIGKIEAASLYAREVVRKLMHFSRQVPQKKKNINLNQVINDALYLFEARCERSGIELLRILENDLPEIYADPSQLTQVLVNLAVNSVQAIKEGGTITLKTLYSDGRVKLIVKDTGEGMTEEVMEQIFNPFFTTKDVDQGTGLGLSVVHGIVMSHGGTVKVSSRVGEGTTFEIIFPVMDMEVKKSQENS